jgi:hypothetical protein
LFIEANGLRHCQLHSLFIWTPFVQPTLVQAFSHEILYARYNLIFFYWALVFIVVALVAVLIQDAMTPLSFALFFVVVSRSLLV